MIRVEIFKHDSTGELERHIEAGIIEGKELISCYTKDIFWTFSPFLKETTITWKV